MKKIFVFLLTFFVLISSSVCVFAEEKADISFDTYSSEDGEKICVDVIISGGGTPSMMQYCVSYDSKVLECVSVSVGGAFSGNNAPVINHVEGKIYFIWDSLTPLSSGGTMIHIEFVSIEKKDTSVGIDETETFIVADSNFTEIGNVTGSAEIDLAEDPEPEVPPESVLKPGETEKPEDEEVDLEEIPSENITESLESKAEITEEDKTVWESGDENVVVIEDGKIVPVSPGQTTITVKTEDGEKEASMEVIVTEDGKIETVEVIESENYKKNESPLYIALIMLAALLSAFAGKKIKDYRRKNSKL